MRQLAYVIAATDIGPMIVNRMDSVPGAITPDGRATLFGVGAQLLETGTCDSAEIDLYKPFLELRRRYFGDGIQVLDCGANIGTVALSLAKHIYGYGDVTAIEAQERIFYCLAGNIMIGNHHNVRAIWGAVGKTTGSLSIPTPDYYRSGSFGSLELVPSKDMENIGQPVSYNASDLTEVRLFTIDSMNLTRLDLLKIDVERMELDVLEGARQTIEKYKPILAIEHLKVGIEAIAEWLVTAGYDTYMVSGMMVIAVHPSDPVGKHIVLSDDKVSE